MQARPFTDTQIKLLETFADQAVIAIENVRLFNETKEALEQQIATSEILRVISSSPTDVQPVFDTIVRSAVRLCDGLFSGVYRFDGNLIHFVAHNNWTDEGFESIRRAYPRAPSRETQVATAILDRTVVEVRDFENDPKKDTRTRAPPGSWHRPSAVRAWRFWLDDRVTRLESLRCSLRSSLGPVRNMHGVIFMSLARVVARDGETRSGLNSPAGYPPKPTEPRLGNLVGYLGRCGLRGP